MKSRNVGRNPSGNSRLVLFGSIKATDGRPVMCVLDLRPTEKGFLLDDMQRVTSAYTKDVNPVEFVKQSKVLYADKKRTLSLLRSIGFKMPIALLRDGFIGNISYSGTIVNLSGADFSDVVLLDEIKKAASRSTSPFKQPSSDTVTQPAEKINSKFSAPATDSAGNALSEGQQEYFKDSKVRDKSGRLLAVYHGTDAQFTTFDIEKAGSATGFNMFGDGFYFTSSKRSAKSYSSSNRVVKAYLNIENPYYAKDADAGRLSRNKLLSEGYDGVVVNGAPGETTYIAFEPEQVKRTDNLNPTNNPDIRFSQQLPVEDLQEKLDIAITMLDNGESNSKVYAATGLVVLANGAIRDGFDGEIIGRYDNGQNNVGAVALGEQTARSGQASRTDTAGMAETSGGLRARGNWEQLGGEERRQITSAVKSHMKTASTEGRRLLTEYGSEKEFAKQFYTMARQGRVVARNQAICNGEKLSLCCHR